VPAGKAEKGVVKPLKLLNAHAAPNTPLHHRRQLSSPSQTQARDRPPPAARMAYVPPHRRRVPAAPDDETPAAEPPAGPSAEPPTASAARAPLAVAVHFRIAVEVVAIPRCAYDEKMGCPREGTHYEALGAARAARELLLFTRPRAYLVALLVLRSWRRSIGGAPAADEPPECASLAAWVVAARRSAAKLARCAAPRLPPKAYARHERDELRAARRDPAGCCLMEVGG
jgi:hypothetical protein